MKFNDIFLTDSFSIYVAFLIGVLGFVAGFVLRSSVAVKEKSKARKLRQEIDSDGERVNKLREKFKNLNPAGFFTDDFDD